MKKNLKMNPLAPHALALRLMPVATALILSGAAITALAQDHGAMPGMDHGPAPAQNGAGAGATAPAMDHGAAPAHGDSMAGMDHGDMQMQGGSPPADARDPHGYSDGFERGSGKYSLPGVPRLQLDDRMSFASLRINRLERAWARHGENATTYDLQARIGRDLDHLIVKSEGDIAQGRLQDSRTELLWGHATSAYWNTQLGVRFDHGAGQDRQWLAFGVQGLAPYWFELDATAYLGSSGRTALRLEASYDWLLTRKLVLQPHTEWNFYGKSDPANDIGSGLSSASAGLRMRYEITLQIAPYVGVEWQHSFGRTGDFVRASGGRTTQTRWVVGMNFWF